MPKTRPWFRLYTEIKDDLKIKKLSPEEKWLWIVLLCLAWESPVRGELLITPTVPCETDDIAGQAGMDPDMVEKALARFEALNMICREGDTWVVVNFKKRQYDKKSDWPENTRARKRTQREREKRVNAGAAQGEITSAGAVKEVARTVGSPAVTPVSLPERDLTETGGGHVENTPTVTPMSRQDSSVEKESGHSEIHPDVTSVSRESHAPNMRDIEGTGRCPDSNEGGEPLPPAGYGVCTFPVRDQECSPAPRSHANVTPLSRGSHPGYSRTSNYISSNNKYKHDDVINNNKQQQHVLKDNAQKESFIPLTLQQEFARPISPTEVDRLLTYLRGGMADEVICDAIKRAALQGSPKVSYVEGILKNWWAQGVRDMAGVECSDQEFKERKKARGGAAGGQRGRGQHRSNYVQDPPQLKYAGLIPTFG